MLRFLKCAKIGVWDIRWLFWRKRVRTAKFVNGLKEIKIYVAVEILYYRATRATKVPSIHSIHFQNVFDDQRGQGNGIEQAPETTNIDLKVILSVLRDLGR